jgi:hypothetical protein
MYSAEATKAAVRMMYGTRVLRRGASLLLLEALLRCGELRREPSLLQLEALLRSGELE